MMSDNYDKLPNADKIHIKRREARKNGLPVVARMGQKSPLTGALETRGQVKWNRSICSTSGQLIGSSDENAGRRKANKSRKDTSIKNAEGAWARHGPDLYDRSLTKRIAHLEGVDVRTIRRWRTKINKNGQA
jgi:hypothetical protein